MTINELKEILFDEKIRREVSNAQTLREFQKIMAGYGVDIPLDELDEMFSSELDEETLAEVAGGIESMVDDTRWNAYKEFLKKNRMLD